MAVHTSVPEIDGLVDVCLRLDAAHLSSGLTPELVRMVDEFCRQVEDAPGPVLAMVQLTGPDTVSPDFESWPGAIDVHLASKWERALRRLERLPTATIGVASGRCVGAAAEVLLTTDLRLAGSDLSLGLSAAGQVWPGMAVFRLAQQIGVARARRLVLFGDRVGAADALAAGLVDRVGDDLRELLLSATKEISGLDGQDLAVRRRLLLEASTTSFETALGAHLAAEDRVLRNSAGAGQADSRP